MTTLHVIYGLDRAGDAEDWSAYSYPHSIYAAGSSLAEVRAEFRRAAAFALGDVDQVAIASTLNGRWCQAPTSGLRWTVGCSTARRSRP